MAAQEGTNQYGNNRLLPAEHAFAISPSDTAEIAYVTRGLWVGGAGNVKVKTQGGETVTFVGVAAGTLLPIRVVQVFATGGTTATDFIGLY
jgi:hypothetical protein